MVDNQIRAESFRGSACFDVTDLVSEGHPASAYLAPHFKRSTKRKMTAADISKIELHLGVTLPSKYIDVLLNYPFEADAGKFEWSIGDDAESIIRWTSDYRNGFAGNPPWPHELICIGTEGDGCPISLNLQSMKVLKIDRGNPEREPLEEHDSFEGYLSECLEDYADL